MAKIIKYNSGKTVIKTNGGFRNTDIFPPEEIEIAEPIEEVDSFESVEETRYGSGTHRYKLYRDAHGQKVMVHSFNWHPAPGYGWQEAWESVYADEDRIAIALSHKVMAEKEL